MTDLHTPSVRAWTTYDLPVPVTDLRSWLVQAASVPDLFAEQAARHGNKTAVRVGDASVTYGQLHDRVARLAGWMAARGVSRGDRVLVMGDNSVELLVACLATMWAGAVEVVANPTYTARELSHLVSDSGAIAALVDSHLKGLLNEELKHAPATVRIDNHQDMVEIRTAEPASAPQMQGGELAALQYTSGTTGHPKGAALTHANVVAYLRSVHIAWSWTDADVLVHSLPLAHGHGRNGVYTALLAGATSIVLPRTDVSAIQSTLTAEHATVFYAVPAIWGRLVNAGDFRPSAFHDLRLYTSGSAALEPSLARQVRSALGNLPLERYGATETGIVVTNPLNGPRVEGTVGQPMPGAEIRIADKHGETVPSGEVGEIVVRGPSVFSGYWRGHGDSDFVDGWYRTGDLGTTDPEAHDYLRIVGRSREMIISGGLNVYPREIEHAALESSLVREAAVVGIPSARWGEEVVMAIVPETPETMDVDAVLAHLRQHLAPYKVPKQIRVVSALPRNHVGKVSQKDLTSLWDLR